MNLIYYPAFYTSFAHFLIQLLNLVFYHNIYQFVDNTILIIYISELKKKSIQERRILKNLIPLLMLKKENTIFLQMSLFIN